MEQQPLTERQPRTSREEVAYTAIPREPVPSVIIRQIQQLLAAQKLNPGDQLPPERALSKLLNVSRATAREALKRLETLGVIEVRRGKGTFVCERQYIPFTETIAAGDHSTRTRLRDALEARACIEIRIADLAAQRATDADLAKISAYLAEAGGEELLLKRQYTFDLGFEQLLAVASKNAVLAELQSHAHATFVSLLREFGIVPRPGTQRQQQHERIFGAVRDHDPAAARAAMTIHLDIYDWTDPAS